MADLLDVENALAALCAAVIYPSGTGQPSAANAIPCRIYAGWPSESDLAVSLAAGQADVTIYSGQNIERDTTRYARAWVDLVLVTSTLTATVLNRTITIGGTVTTGHYATIIIDGAAYSYAALAGDTLTTIAAALVALMPGGVAASNAGPVITVAAKYQGLIVARTAAPGTVGRELGRQERGFMVTVWAPSPQARSVIGSLLMTTLRGTDFMPMPDGSQARVTYRQSNESDGKENAMAYRRDINIWVEYATVETAAGYPITTNVNTVGLAPGIPNATAPVSVTTAQ